MFYLFTFIAIVMIYFFYYEKNKKEPHWDWKNIKIDPKEVADKIYQKNPNFLFGSAVSSHQVEGGNKNDWTVWEDTPGKIENGDKSGNACEFWTRYKEDIARMKKLNFKVFRFSLEWSRFQPNGKDDEYDKNVAKVYHSMIDELLKNGIKPSLTFHHFTLPIWFAKLGGFRKRENSIYFENFCEWAFKEFSGKVTHFSTINEPNIYAEAGYIASSFAPGEGPNPILAMKVVGNLLHAHTQVYHKLKKMKNGKKCQIGIVKNVQQSNAYSQWNPLEWIIAKGFEYVHDHAVINYFKTGAYTIPVPFIAVTYYNEKGKNSLDFIGLNYYMHNILKVGCGVETVHRPNEEVTDMNWSLYGEGLYYALKYVSGLNVPIYITENGIADKSDGPYKRNLFYTRYMYALSEAMKEGVDVRGYMTWSLLDNFEWAHGYKMKFGLYDVDFKTQKRTLKKGLDFFLKLVEYSPLNKTEKKETKQEDEKIIELNE